MHVVTAALMALGKRLRSPSSDDACDETEHPFRPLVPMSWASSEPPPSAAKATEADNLEPPHEELPSDQSKMNRSDGRSIEERLVEVERALFESRTSATKLQLQEDEEETLWKAATAEGFATRGAMGLKFNRAPDGGQSHENKASGLNREAKAEFRTKWASVKYTQIKVSRETPCGGEGLI